MCVKLVCGSAPSDIMGGLFLTIDKLDVFRNAESTGGRSISSQSPVLLSTPVTMAKQLPF